MVIRYFALTACSKVHSTFIADGRRRQPKERNATPHGPHGGTFINPPGMVRRDISWLGGSSCYTLKQDGTISQRES
jgi:hypothetical protein